ncbi:melatonin-related receptor-like isoform X1 [Choristoneura fumiferana]
MDTLDLRKGSVLMHGGRKNETERVFSLVTLNHAWPKRDRLLFTVACSVFGCIMNGFFVASFFVEDHLKRIGLVFHACVGMSDLIVSMAVIPVSAVVLLSGEWDTDAVCYALQFLTEASTYSYSIFFALVAVETYYRLCRSSEEYDVFISKRVDLISLFVFAVSFITAAVGVYLGLDYDCCYRLHYGNFTFRITTNVILHVIPCLITIFCLSSASLKMKSRAKKHNHYRKSQQYENDRYAHYLNITAFILYVSAWLPYVIVVHEFPATTDSRFYQSVWLGVGRSVITSVLYGTMDRRFRRAFAHLFNYCFCKSTLSGPFASRHRRACEYRAATGDVRVHIMHQAVNANSPQRAASSTREMQELR